VSEEPTVSAQSPYWIGTAGWIYDDWAGIFYPIARPRGFQPLAYYARFFNFAEVNATFYRVMPPSAAEAWCRAVAFRPDFAFSLKLWQGLTHERPATLPEREVGTIRALCDVLAAQGRLASILMQFPWSFRATPENADYLQRLLEALAPLPCTVEIRHAGWHTPEFFALLREHGATFCNIDQPLLRDCAPPSSVATAPLGYLRLHGRNAANWFREKVGAAVGAHAVKATGTERYDYYYPPAEVEEMARLAEALAAQASRVAVTTNNHYRGQAAADALLLRAALEGQVDAIPPTLARAFPDLRQIPARQPMPDLPPEAEQPDLFGG
jgi:uncharacterized protein YecE (DUF72 family)